MREHDQGISNNHGPIILNNHAIYSCLYIGVTIMKNLDTGHEKLVKQLEIIKKIMEDMRDEGLGGMDFEGLYLNNRLIPSIIFIFTRD